MLACSFDVSASNAIGLLCAFGSALVFVSSNIFFKKVMPSHSEGTSSVTSHKLDKMNLLLYSSGMAFLLMVPIWIYYDLPVFLSGTTTTAVQNEDEPPHSVIYYFFINGTVHYAQNIIAFVILSSTSPVTYSIASLIKRVAVICIAIIWFRQSVHLIQALGIVMTFAGLYMYNNAKGDVDKGEKKLRRIEAAKDMMLPTTKADSRMMLGTESPPETIPEHTIASATGSGTVYGRNWGGQSKSGVGHQTSFSHQQHRPPAPPFHIQTSKDVFSRKEIPPIELYPSPPSSQNSPPSQTIPLPVEQRNYAFQHDPIPKYLRA
jgi:solute carrier family 35 protein E1